MYDIIEVFNRYLSEYGSIDIAESEFKKIYMRTPNSKLPTVSGVKKWAARRRMAFLITAMNIWIRRMMFGTH